MTRPRFTIEHRLPRGGEMFLDYNARTVPNVYVAGSDYDGEHDSEYDVLVPLTPPWPDKRVIVIDDGKHALDIGDWELPVIAVRTVTSRYIDEHGRWWSPDRDTIIAWHEYIPDGCVQKEEE